MLDCIKTKRCQLTPIEPSDAHFLYDIWKDKRVNRYMNIEPFSSYQEVKAIICEIQSLPYARRYTIRHEGIVIGSAGFNTWNAQDCSVEIGYDFARSYWKKGYGIEIVKALCHVATQQQMKKVRAHIDIRNEASIRLVRRLHFQQTDQFIEDGLHYITYTYDCHNA